MSVASSSVPPFDILNDEHVKHLILVGVVYLDEVLEVPDQVDGQGQEPVQVGALQEGHQVQRDELQTVDLKLVHDQVIRLLIEVQGGVQGEAQRDKLQTDVCQGGHRVEGF